MPGINFRFPIIDEGFDNLAVGAVNQSTDTSPTPPGKRGTPFSAAEMAMVRSGYQMGTPARQIAIRLGRSPRGVNTHYQKLRGTLPRLPHGKPRAEPKREKGPLNNPARFYRSEFVPT